MRPPLGHRTKVPARPPGNGFLYVRRDLIEQLEPPFLDLHAAIWTSPSQYEIPDARRFENWETNYAAKTGPGVAVDYALSWGLEAIAARVTALADSLRTQLTQLDGVRVHDQGQRQQRKRVKGGPDLRARSEVGGSPSTCRMASRSAVVS